MSLCRVRWTAKSGHSFLTVQTADKTRLQVRRFCECPVTGKRRGVSRAVRYGVQTSAVAMDPWSLARSEFRDGSRPVCRERMRRVFDECVFYHSLPTETPKCFGPSPGGQFGLAKASIAAEKS